MYANVVALIEAGVPGPPSRNLHFEEWRDPVLGPAYRMFGRLKRLSREVEGQLRQGRPVAVERGHEEGDESDVLHVRYALENSRGTIRRTARLTSREWELLVRLCPSLQRQAAAHPGSPL